MARLPELPDGYRWRIGYMQYTNQPALFLEKSHKGFFGKIVWKTKCCEGIYPHIWKTFEAALASAVKYTLDKDDFKKEVRRFHNLSHDIAVVHGKHGVYSGGAEV